MKKNFKTIKLNEVADLKRGPFGGALKKSIFVPDGYKVYEQKNAIYNDFSLGSYYINSEKFQEMKSFEIIPDDIIMSCSGTIGKLSIAPQGIKSGIINQALLRIRPSEKVYSEFLKLYLESEYVQKKYLLQTSGTAMQNLKPMKVIKEIPINLPDLEMQSEILSKIKECFTLLDKAEEKLKQAEDKLNNLMDSVYHKELPTPENLNGSTITKLDVLAEKITDGSHNPPMKQKNGKLMLSAINIENDFLNIEANVRYIKVEDFNKELNRSGVKKGDVLLTAVGTIGRTLVVKEFTDFVLQRSVTLIRPKDTEISQYLSYYLRTPYMQRYFLENAKGTAQKGIYLSTIRKLEVVIPERSKMRAIIEKIDNVRNATTNSLKHIKSLQKNLQIERQSILKKAFEGRLI